MKEVTKYINEQIGKITEKEKLDEEEITRLFRLLMRISNNDLNILNYKSKIEELERKVKVLWFKGDIIITDPCYIINKDNSNDWERCEYGDRMDNLGIYNCLVSNTLYGDWSCTTYKTEDKSELGDFCADAGLVGVFLLDEVLKYNPSFNYHIEKPWTTTLIKDFDGAVRIEVFKLGTKTGYDGEKYEDEEVRVIGEGNINFITSQTGL